MLIAVRHTSERVTSLLLKYLGCWRCEVKGFLHLTTHPKYSLVACSCTGCFFSVLLRARISNTERENTKKVELAVYTFSI